MSGVAVEPTIVQWMAVQAQHERYARLVEAGSDADAQLVELATIFVDLPISTQGRHFRPGGEQGMAMPYLLGQKALGEGFPLRTLDREGGAPRLLVVGGPGSGKSTLTTMLAQVLRLAWVERQADALPVDITEVWQELSPGLSNLLKRLGGTAAEDLLPLRIDLPDLTRFLASRRGQSREGVSLWDYLAERLRKELDEEGFASELGAAAFREAVLAAPRIYWILDGLDEVPETAGRREVLALVREGMALGSRLQDGLLVVTRPQGYADEFRDLPQVELSPLPIAIAKAYAERILRAWSRGKQTRQLDEQLANLETEFAKPEVATLLHSPLHTTMAALLVATRGKLPTARSQLFETYFDTILRREQRKLMDHGLPQDPEAMLRALHARAGLLLHVRAQGGASARPSLRRKELHALLSAWYREQGHREGEIREAADRVMRFAVERLVLLLHSSEGEYSFGVRSIQEFFAAEALVDAEPGLVAERLRAIATSPHWRNVLLFVMSRYARRSDSRDKPILEAFAAICRALNEGALGGDAAKRSFAGSVLALDLLEETKEYGQPLLHAPLWEIALEAASFKSWWIGDLVATWPGAGLQERQKQVLKLAEEQLKKGGEAQIDGWGLLWGMLMEGHAGAVALAEQYAPRTASDAAIVVQEVFGSDRRMPPWWADFVDGHAEWFVPCWQLGGLDGVHVPIVSAYTDLFFAERATIEFALDDQSFSWLLQSTEAAPGWEEMAQRVASTPPSWDSWKQLANFMASPSHKQLANVLESIADEAALHRILVFRSVLPWPLAACLCHVLHHGSLPKLIAAARAGELGTLDDWRAAETRWKESPHARLVDVEAARLAETPWPGDIATRGMVWAMPRSVQTHLGMPLSFAKMGGSGAFYSPFGQWLYGPLTSAPDLAGAGSEDWFALFDAHGRCGANDSPLAQESNNLRIRKRGLENLHTLCERIASRPEQWGLLDALLALLDTFPDEDLSNLVLPALPADAPTRAHALHGLLKILAGQEDPATLSARLGSLIFEEQGKKFDFRKRLAEIIRKKDFPTNTTPAILQAALDASPPPSPNVGAALLHALLITHYKTAPAAFNTEASWRASRLPEPFLPEYPPASPAARLVRIDELRNIRLFQEPPLVDQPFPIPSDESGQWIVFVGENGVGKTTLLRAIALCLASPDVGTNLLNERLPLLRNGGEANVQLALHDGPLAITIRRNERGREVIEQVSTTPKTAKRPWVVAYGVRRGNAQGEQDRLPEKGELGELHTLFDRPASLYNAVQWLNALDADVMREQQKHKEQRDHGSRGRAGIWRAVTRALRTLLGITKIEVVEGGLVLVEHPQFGRVRLDTLSDGYLTTAGWIIDMIARFVERQRELDEPIGANLLSQMTGFVLMDEIDLHLHPLWQTRILGEVRRLFPRLSFLVTTHNPLTLEGARPGEVYVMRRREARIEMVQKDIRPGQDVDRVLFEQFGVEHTFDKDTRDLLKKHVELIARGAKPEDPERQSIEAKIADRFGSLGHTLQKERNDANGPVAPLAPEEQDAFIEQMKNLPPRQG